MTHTKLHAVPRSSLSLPRQRLAEIRSLAARAYPEECCGVLVGRQPCPAGPVQVVEVVATANDETAKLRRHGYRIPPSALLAAHRRARERQLAIVGFYHSHPDRPPVPSRSDWREAWPGVSYLIVAVSPGRDPELRSWRLAEDRSRLVEERLLSTTEASRSVPRQTPGARS